MKKSLAHSALLLGALGAVGCQDDEKSAVEVQSTGLAAFGSCDALLDYFQTEALTEVQFYGWAEPVFAGGRAVDDAVGAPTAEGGEGPDGNGAPAFSTTNVQEAGVDEPDLVKTDGRFLYVARNQSVLIYDAADLTLTGQLELDGWISGLLLDGDRLVALTSPQGEAVRPAGVPERFGRVGRTGVVVLDVSDRSLPRLLRQTEVEGGLVAARLTGGTVRAVVHFDGAWGIQWDLPGGFGGGVAVGGDGSGGGTTVDSPPSEPTEPPAQTDPAPGMASRADAQAVDVEGAWRAAVAATTLADWVPYRIDLTGEVRTGGPIASCTDFQRPGERAGHGVTAIVSIDLNHLDAVRADPAVVSAPGVVYANTESLYLATVNHAGWLVAGGGDVAVGAPTDVAVEPGIDSQASPLVAEPERQATQIHKLSIADASAPAIYRGSGRVFGVPLNSFALSEFAQHLRIGTTEDGPEGTTNHLWVLGAGGDSGLEVTGSVQDLAPGERIYAMRFLGDRGFMVTFRQVDPLFTFDLADPTHPQQVGELKVPGFSTYLHPFDADHLLGLGQAATEGGQITGMQLSLFNVQDLAAPTLAQKADLGEGWSEALYDHHAFTFWAPESLVLVPVDRWDGEAQHTGLDLYRVDAATGFAADGHVSHATLVDGWLPPIRRSIIIGDGLYSVSEAGIMAHDLASLETRASAVFPAIEGGGDGRPGVEVPAPDGT